LKCVQNSLKFVADTDKNVTETVIEGECSDEIGCVKEMIQMTTEEWKINSKLHLEKKKKR
jgi:hypothetical protein